MESFSNIIYHGSIVNGTYVSRPSIVQDDPIVDVSNLTNPQKYCIKMTMKKGTPTHYYTLVDCNETAYHLCRKTPVDCLNLNSRHKRSTTKASLDRVFVPAVKQIYDEAIKKIRQSYSENFKKMDLQKSYPNLFQILW